MSDYIIAGALSIFALKTVNSLMWLPTSLFTELHSHFTVICNENHTKHKCNIEYFFINYKSSVKYFR